MAEIPKPEEVVAALTTFPPRLSILVKPLALPEEMFETSVKNVTGVEVPPGPTKMTLSIMTSFEEVLPATLPKLTLPIPTPSLPRAELTPKEEKK
jgi:hypothetical protein